MVKETKELIPVDETSELSQDELFAIGMLTYNTVREAGEFAGYAVSTIDSGFLYRKAKSPKFLDLVRDIAKNYDVLNIPRLLRIEDKVLDHLDRNPLDINKYKEMIRQKKTIAGLLKQESDKGQNVFVDIKHIQNLMLKAHE